MKTKTFDLLTNGITAVVVAITSAISLFLGLVGIGVIEPSTVAIAASTTNDFFTVLYFIYAALGTAILRGMYQDTKSSVVKSPDD